MQKKILIILTCRNSLKLFDEQLASVVRLEVEDDLKIEVLVIDTSHMRLAVNIVDKIRSEVSIRIEYIDIETKNLALIRNLPLKRYKADYYVYLEECFFPTKYWLVKSFDYFRKNIDLDVLFSCVEISDRIKSKCKHLSIFIPELFNSFLWYNGNFILSKEKLDRFRYPFAYEYFLCGTYYFLLDRLEREGAVVEYSKESCLCLDSLDDNFFLQIIRLAFLIGDSACRFEKANLPFINKLMILVKSVAVLVISCFVFPFMLILSLISRFTLYFTLWFIFYSFGKLSALCYWRIPVLRGVYE